MSLYSVYAFALSVFLLLTVSAMAHSKQSKNAGDMHKMVIPSNKKLKVQNDDPVNSEMDDSLREFCRTFEKSYDMHDLRGVSELRSACDGHCSNCANCPRGCRALVSRGCARLFKNKSSVLKMRSPLEEKCMKFLE
ncbi:uncharacterized protein LOC106668975 [Cimex lectularius]|uniref:Uncharacterized protein n=1 Tax=Cimex lectularius TaxID=79782 RepID=A0A8I6RYC9_CIMLE|nr:uncharacterized protein LOC106668975 [Cimex lectularius]